MKGICRIRLGEAAYDVWFIQTGLYHIWALCLACFVQARVPVSHPTSFFLWSSSKQSTDWGHDTLHVIVTHGAPFARSRAPLSPCGQHQPQ